MTGGREGDRDKNSYGTKQGEKDLGRGKKEVR